MRPVTIQMLWIGSRLSTMERLSIASFLRNGCEVDLYCYETPEGTPKGTTIRDANEILPEGRIFRYTGNGSFAGFSNFFRYKLLLERGGWWMDSDTVAVRGFDFTAPFVFGSQAEGGAARANCNAIFVPAASRVMEMAWEYCQRCEPAQLRWGQTGPDLIRYAIQKAGLEDFVHPPEVFCPIGYPEWRTMLEPRPEYRLPEGTYAVHLWNEMWRQGGAAKDGRYPETSLYEALKRQYLTE